VTLWVEGGAIALAGFGASVAFAVALGRSAKYADEVIESSPEVAEIAADLERLSTVRSPAGRRFYPTPHARRELAEIVHEACSAGWSPTR
jgi:hypothetical protein